MNDISFKIFNHDDVVRHPVVARIVRAYEVHDAEQERIRKEKKEQALKQQTEDNSASNANSGDDE